MHEPQPAQRPCWGTLQFAPTAAWPMAIPAPANHGAASFHRARAPWTGFNLCVSDRFIVPASFSQGCLVASNRLAPLDAKCDRSSEQSLDRNHANGHGQAKRLSFMQTARTNRAGHCAISRKSRQMTQECRELARLSHMARRAHRGGTKPQKEWTREA
jgi:hypothetical protein